MIYISNESYYNSKSKMNQLIFKKWKIKQQYKEFYRMLAEGFLFITVLLLSVMSLFIWFY